MSFILFLLAHLLGDFTFQPKILVEMKKQRIGYQIMHSAIYAVLFMLVIVMFEDFPTTVLLTASVFIIHFIIDFLRIKSDNETKSQGNHFMSFILDQVIHIIIVIIVNFIIGDFNETGLEFLFKIADLTGVNNLYSIMLIVLAYIIILSPASVFIEYFSNYYFEIDEGETTTKRIGSLIGKLERILILTLGLMGYYLAIGLVLTAKSIARFKQLDNKDFAEKYLVGTLLSLIFAVICIAVVNLAIR